MERGGEAMHRRLFCATEGAGADVESLTGIFGAKEAAFKALELPLWDWLVLEIGHELSGRPQIALRPDYDASDVVDIDLSISHAGGIAVASVVVLVQLQNKGNQV